MKQTKFALFVLFLLYLSQGLPYGFQKMALPILLRDGGVSLASIGFLGALAAPWLFKALWAPLLDRYYLTRWGRRKSWIIPLQCLFLGTIIVAAVFGTSDLTVLLVCVFCMNLFAATQDIAVDGFAIDILKPHALGLGNTAQVVGYKAGMIIAGGILLSLTQSFGWRFLFAGMALLTLLPLLPLVFFKEKPVPPGDPDEAGGAAERPTFKEIIRRASRLVRDPGLRWAIVFIMSCKVGEELVENMFTVFLFDHGITREQIGTWVGSYGMIASITGSIVGGLLITRMRVWTVLGIGAVMKLVPIAMQWWLTQSAVTPGAVIGSTIFEHLAGGIVTTALFTFMMSLVEKRAGATEYTLLASLQVLGKAPAAMCSGLIAQHFGYGPLFFSGLVISALTLIPWWKCRHLAET